MKLQSFTNNKISYFPAITIAIALLFIAPYAYAQGEGGFKGPGPDLTTVKQALAMQDDARVTLKGNIIKSLGDEDYFFKDDTGTIEVEIDDKLWRNQVVTPEDLVIISGEVEKDRKRTSIDVFSINKQ